MFVSIQGSCRRRMNSSYEIGFPQAFASTEELVAGSSADNEVFRKVDTTDAVETADEGLSGGVVDASNDRTDEVWAEALLVEGR